MTPSAKMSARWSTGVVGSPNTCSGAMYAGVPNAAPALVIVPLAPASHRALASPKSATTAWPVHRNTLSGLMSRWTTPCSCA
jgi:hypothetical protein